MKSVAYVAPIMFAPPGDTARSMANAPVSRQSPGPSKPAEQPIAQAAPAEPAPAQDNAAAILAALKAAEQEVIAEAARPASNRVLTGNRFIDTVFSSWIFKASDSDRVFLGERDGSKSKKLATVVLELAGSGAYLKGNIYAKQAKGADRARAEFGFFGAQNQSSILVDDMTAKHEMSVFKAYIAAEFVKWAKATTTPGTPSAHVETGVALDISL